MHTKVSSVVAWLAGFLASLLLLLSPVNSTGAQGEPVIRVGVTSSDAFAEAYYAAQLGLFKKAGLNVEITPFTTGAAVATGVASGAVDIGVSNVGLLGWAIGHGTPFVFIAGGALYTSAASITSLCVLEIFDVSAPREISRAERSR